MGWERERERKGGGKERRRGKAKRKGKGTPLETQRRLGVINLLTERLVRN